MEDYEPMKEYDEMVTKEGYKEGTGTGSGWMWEDQSTVDDFNSIKVLKQENIITNLLHLKAFYLIYLGEISSATNVGGLCC